MKQYIDKSALIAEIENKIKKYTKRGEESDAKRDGYGMYWGGVLSCLNEIRTLCDTLEVKDVDFETEWKKYFEHKGNLATVNVKDLAKHFFDLGLKAQKGE